MEGAPHARGSHLAARDPSTGYSAMVERRGGPLEVRGGEARARAAALARVAHSERALMAWCFPPRCTGTKNSDRARVLTSTPAMFCAIYRSSGGACRVSRSIAQSKPSLRATSQKRIPHYQWAIDCGTPSHDDQAMRAKPNTAV